MGELIKLIKSFGYAFQGLGHAVWTQRNMRIHLVAVWVAAFFGHLAHLESAEWCAVILCCMGVLSLELINTALERLCDQITAEVSPRIKHAKDCAAGAVLLSALGSLLVAGVLVARHYLQIAKYFRLYRWPKYTLLAGVVLGIVFVFLPASLQSRKRERTL